MLKCCIKDCESYKYSVTKNIGYFQFPVHDEALLKRWLKQIDLPNWKPATYHHICSMHFREEDLDRHPSRKQPYLKPTSIPTVFPGQPIEIVAPNSAKSNGDSQFQLSTKFLNVVSDAPLLQNSPVILIPAHYPQELSMQFPTQIVAQNFHPSAVNNSMQISAELAEEIRAQHSRIPLHNCEQTSVRYLNQTKVQYTRADRYVAQIDAQSPLQVAASNEAHIAARCTKQIVAQAPKQYTKRIASQSCAKFSEQYPKQVTVSLDSGRDGEQQISESVGIILPILQPRLRKILPKPQSFDPNTVPTVGSLQKSQTNSTTNSIPKPDILIIPKIENSHPNGSGKAVLSHYPGNKRPILRISINKVYESKKSHITCEKKEGNGSSIDTRTSDASVENANSSTGMIRIENSSTNKAVTFKLDPKTGEIVVTTRELVETTKDDADLKSTRRDSKLDDNRQPATKLRQLYIKGQQECSALRRKLRVLRQHHKKEQQEIEKLQEHLTELGDKVEKTCREYSPELRFAKRKETESSIKPKDYEIWMREAKKMKHDIQGTRRDSSTMANGQLKAQGSQPSANCNKGASTFSKVEYHSRKTEELSEGEIVGEIADKGDIVVSKVEVSSMGINAHSASQDPSYKAEFLDAEFLIG